MYRRNSQFKNVHITPSARRILNYLFPKPDGAGIKKISYETKIRSGRVLKLLEELELAGEVFRCKGKWRSTAAAMRHDPKPERLRDEFEHDLFGKELTPRLREFLTEFSGGVKLGLSIDESFHFAQRKLAESKPQAVGCKLEARPVSEPTLAEVRR